MGIISTTCPTGPLKSKECLAFFGVEYQAYLWIIAISLLIGFGLYFVYSKIKKIEFEVKSYITKSLIISLIVFVLLSILSIFFQSTIVY